MDARAFLLERARIRQDVAQRRHQAKIEWDYSHHGMLPFSPRLKQWLWRTAFSLPAGFLMRSIGRKVSRFFN